MLRYKIFRVKEGKLSVFRNWCETLSNRKDEVKATLKHENVVSESYRLFSRNGEDFVIGMQWIQGEHRKADMEVELNRQHFAIIQECLDPVQSETLCEITRDEETRL